MECARENLQPSQIQPIQVTLNDLYLDDLPKPEAFLYVGSKPLLIHIMIIDINTENKVYCRPKMTNMYNTMNTYQVDYTCKCCIVYYARHISSRLYMY